MRNCLLYSMTAAAGPLFFSMFAFAQTGQQPARGKGLDPHNLSGVWIGKSDGKSAVDTRLRPPMTPWAQARFDAAVPTLGPRDVPGKENDPILHCNPDGIH